MDNVLDGGTLVQGVLDFGDPGLMQAAATTQLLLRVKHKKPRVIRRNKHAGKPDLQGVDLNLPLFAVDDFVYSKDQEVMEVAPAANPVQTLQEAAASLWRKDEAPSMDRVLASAAPGQTQAHVSPDQVPEGFPEVTLEIFTKVHAGLLYRQLELLLWSQDGASATRMEILDWIFADNPHGIHYPFSFELCCYVEEIDAHTLRETIRERINQIQRGSGHRIRASLH